MRKRRRERKSYQSKEHGKSSCLLVGCLTSQQHASVSQGRICVVFLSCPLVKKHADLLGSFLYSLSTMKDMYSKPTNRTELLSIPMKTNSLA